MSGMNGTVTARLVEEQQKCGAIPQHVGYRDHVLGHAFPTYKCTKHTFFCVVVLLFINEDTKQIRHRTGPQHLNVVPLSKKHIGLNALQQECKMAAYKAEWLSDGFSWSCSRCDDAPFCIPVEKKIYKNEETSKWQTLTLPNTVWSSCYCNTTWQKYSHPFNLSTFSHIISTNFNVFFF